MFTDLLLNMHSRDLICLFHVSGANSAETILHGVELVPGTNINSKKDNDLRSENNYKAESTRTGTSILHQLYNRNEQTFSRILNEKMLKGMILICLYINKETAVLFWQRFSHTW